MLIFETPLIEKFFFSVIRNLQIKLSADHSFSGLLVVTFIFENTNNRNSVLITLTFLSPTYIPGLKTKSC